MKIPFLRDGPERAPRMINASILRSSFERRGLLIGAVQGGVGVLLALIPKWLVVFVLAGMYLGSLLLPLHPNEKRTVAAFSAFAAIALLIDGPFSVKLGCLLIAVLVNYKNWRDAHITVPLWLHWRS